MNTKTINHHTFFALILVLFVAVFFAFQSTAQAVNVPNGGGGATTRHTATTNDSDAEIVKKLCSIDYQDIDEADCRRIISENLSQCYNFVGSPDQEIAQQENCRQSAINIHRNIIQQRLSREGSSQGSSFDSGEGGDCSDGLHPNDCDITRYIRILTDGLSVLVGVVVVMMIVIGGIQYSSAGSNPQAVAAAKKRISQALFALLIYIFMVAFLQWLIPGGVIN